MGLVPTSIKTSAYTAVANDLVRVNSIGGAFTVTLPATPIDGELVGVLDIVSACGVNSVLLATAGGKSVEGDAIGLSVNISGAYVVVCYDDSTENWKILDTPILTTASGVGDVVGQESSVDSEIALFSGTSGKSIKRATTTGILKASNGVISAAIPGADYLIPGSVTDCDLTMATAKLLGRTTAANGAIEEIEVSGATLSNGMLAISSSTAANGSSLVLLSTATANNSAMVDLEVTFDNTYDYYCIVATNVLPSIDASSLLGRTKHSGTYDSGPNYRLCIQRWASTSPTVNNGEGGTSYTFIVLDGGGKMGASSPRAGCFLVDIFNPTTSGYKNGMVRGAYNSAAGVFMSVVGSFCQTTASPMTGFRFFMDSGTIYTGSFCLYGVRKS